MFKYLIVIIIGFYGHNLSANYIDYYRHINEAEYQMYNGNYDLAIANFSMGFNEVEHPHARDLYYMARCYGQIRDEIQMYGFLEQALKKGLTKHQIIRDSLWFTDYRFSKEFTTLTKQNYPQPKAIDNSYKQQVERIWIEAFKYTFADLDSVRTFYGIDSKTYQEYELKRKTYNDSLSKQFFLLFLEHPTPDFFDNRFDFVDDRGRYYKLRYVFSTMFLYLNSTDDYANDVIKKLHLGLLAGKVPPVFYAGIIDYHLRRQDKPVKYGTIYNTINPDDLTSIIENRTAIGVSTYYASSPFYEAYILDNDITYNYKGE